MNKLICLYKSGLIYRLLAAIILTAVLLSMAAPESAKAALWTEGFTSNLPNSWVTGSSGNPSWSITGNWYQNSDHPSTAHFSMTGVGVAIWLDSPMIQIPTQGAKLNYKHSMLGSQVDMGAKLLYSLDGSNWIQLESYNTWDRDCVYVDDGPCHIMYYWNDHSVSLPASTYGQQVVFRWMFYNNEYPYNMEFWIDDVALSGLGDSESFSVSNPGAIDDLIYNQPYEFSSQMTVSGGIPPYTASVIPADPIPGLTFSIDEQYHVTISGKPTAAGTYNVIFQVQDSYQFPQTRQFPYTLNVHDNTTTTLTIPAEQPTVGPERIFTATVQRNSDGAVLSTTSTEELMVAFLADGKVLPDCANVRLDSSANGVATCKTKYLADGEHTITAEFAGSRVYEPSTSNALPYAHSCAPASLVVTTAERDTYGEIPGSLLSVANRSCVGGTITFADDYDIQLVLPLFLDRDVTIDGGTHAITIRGGLKAFVIYPDTTVSLKNMTVQNGTLWGWYRDWYTDEKSGCAIDNRGTLSVMDMMFIDGVNYFDTTNAYDCGMVYNDTLGRMTVTDSTFTDNTAYSAIRNLGTLTVTGSTFTGNDAMKVTDLDEYKYHGGAIHNSGTLEISNSNFINNNDDLKAANINRNTFGGAIYSDRLGTLTITGSTFTGNYAPDLGGAVGIAGETFSISDSVFDSNSAGGLGGGAIMAYGYGSVENSTFSNNTATAYGGAVIGVGSISNSTFYRNSAADNGGAIVSFITLFSTPNITNNTFVDNSTVSGAGTIYLNLLHSEATTTPNLTNNLLVKGTSGANCQFDTGVAIVARNNLTDDDSCGSTGFTQMTADQMLLGTLNNYGGLTQTFALLPGSPAIDGGSNALCPASDQRGVIRPQGTACDIGAFESQGFILAKTAGDNQSVYFNTPFTDLSVSVTANEPTEPVDGGKVTFSAPASGASAVISGSPAVISNGQASVQATSNHIGGSYAVTASAQGAARQSFALTNQCTAAITVQNDNDSGPGSLREAIASTCSGGTITFSGDTTIHLASQLSISKDLTINGETHSVVISGDTDSNGTADVPVFYVYSPATTPLITVNLSNLTVTQGTATYGGGLLNQGEHVFIDRSVFTGNTATMYGGGISNGDYGSLTITNSTLSANSASNGASGTGGAVYSLSDLQITNTTIANNSAYYQGGGVYFNSMWRSFGMTNSTLSGNDTTNGGMSSLYLMDFASAGIHNSIVYDNSTKPNCINRSGKAIAGSNNLADDSSCGTGFTNSTTILLGSLGSYGGSTQTIPLLPGSAAIDSGDNTHCPATDQRGVTRPQGAGCDIGAYEYEPPVLTLDHFFLMPEPSLAGYPMMGMYVDFSSEVDNHSGATDIPYTCTVDYGDGTVRAGEVMSRDGHFVYACYGDEQYTYDSEGTYNVTFTIKDLTGAELAAFTTQHTVTLPNRGYITFTPNLVLVNSPTSFTASEDGYDAYYWFVIDQENGGMGQTAEITFTEPGTYKVMLIAIKYVNDGTNLTTETLADGVDVEVIAQAPAPVLSNISPAAAPAGSGDLTLTVTGSGFMATSVVRWNGIDLATTYASATELSALIPVANLASVQTAQITVFTPAPGGGTSATLAFFVTQSTADVTSQDVASGDDKTASTGMATATATGDGLLVVAEYGANPGGTPSFNASGVYFDVYTAPESNFTHVEITACNLNGGDKLYWWDVAQEKWLKANPQSFADGCITLIVTDTSSPSLSQLHGTFFATGTDLNTAPTANPGGPYLAAINTNITFDGNASTDPEGDALTFTWDFGDGTIGTGAMPAHAYTAAGIYNVCLKVNDGLVDSEPFCTLAVVYDPSAGFVTGGGWINSPEGAYTADPSLSGKATFGFVSKYQKGASAPTGNTEFQFQAGGFNFRSISYDWLVVSKDKVNAQFKGRGTVNGALDPSGKAYKFMLWAGDGTPDTFRIRIWWEDANGMEHDVYDNGFNQPIGGGSIVVHTGK